MSETVLFIDDERDLTTGVSHFLRREGFLVLTAHDGRTGLELARRERPDLILLDLMMPELSGNEVLKALRSDRATAAIPVILVSARNEEIDRLLGFELGADDYVTKPLSLRELVMRVRAVLKRRAGAAPTETGKLHAGPISVDLESHEVRVSGARVQLTLTEFQLLADLLRARGRVRPRESLLSEVWGYDTEVESRTVDTHVRRLRTKLHDASGWLQTVRGIGYRIDPPEGD
jgi:two-component system phosphate regulon response regulator PhoB